jgi:uncharacterized protein (DUF4415 family)
MNNKSKTDWERIRSMKDEDIDYSDIPDRGDDEEFWADAEIVTPPKKVSISIRLDADLLEWLKSRQAPYQTLINGVLRNYMEYHKTKKQQAA